MRPGDIVAWSGGPGLYRITRILGLDRYRCEPADDPDPDPDAGNQADRCILEVAGGELTVVERHDDYRARQRDDPGG